MHDQNYKITVSVVLMSLFELTPCSPLWVLRVITMTMYKRIYPYTFQTNVFLISYIIQNCTVDLPGGPLEIEWREADNHVYMTGPAEVVFYGSAHL